MIFLSSFAFFSKFTFSKKNTVRVSNGLDPSPELGPNCLSTKVINRRQTTQELTINPKVFMCMSSLSYHCVCVKEIMNQYVFV